MLHCDVPAATSLRVASRRSTTMRRTPRASGSPSRRTNNRLLLAANAWPGMQELTRAVQAPGPRRKILSYMYSAHMYSPSQHVTVQCLCPVPRYFFHDEAGFAEYDAASSGSAVLAGDVRPWTPQLILSHGLAAHRLRSSDSRIYCTCT